ASSNVSMRSEASPTTSSTSERRRHVEINDYAVPADPAPRLLAAAETRPLHDLAQRGLVDESIDVEYEIPVGGVQGKSNVSLTSVQVDRLGSYHYERTPLDFKRLQDVEQGSPCDDVAWIRFARHPGCAPSSSSGPPPLLDHDPGSSADLQQLGWALRIQGHPACSSSRTRRDQRARQRSHWRPSHWRVTRVPRQPSRRRERKLRRVSGARRLSRPGQPRSR